MNNKPTNLRPTRQTSIHRPWPFLHQPKKQTIFVFIRDHRHSWRDWGGEENDNVQMGQMGRKSPKFVMMMSKIAFVNKKYTKHKRSSSIEKGGGQGRTGWDDIEEWSTNRTTRKSSFIFNIQRGGEGKGLGQLALIRIGLIFGREWSGFNQSFDKN